jgi:hypothetical protein
LRVQTIFGLIKHNGLRAVQNLIGDFLATMGWQTMHHNRIGSGSLQQALIYLEALEILPPLDRLGLLAH